MAEFKRSSGEFIISFSGISIKKLFYLKRFLTKTHSSRTHTARSLPYGGWGGGGHCPGGLCPRGSLSGGLCPRGVSLSKGVSAQGGLPDRDPPVNRMTDMCSNITLPQLLCGR